MAEIETGAPILKDPILKDPALGGLTNPFERFPLFFPESMTHEGHCESAVQLRYNHSQIHGDGSKGWTLHVGDQL